MQFEGKSWVREFGLRYGKIAQGDVQRLIAALDEFDFDHLPDDFPADACETFATCNPTMWVTVMKGATLKRVAYYFGCKDGALHDQIERIVKLGERIDEIVETSLWIGTDDERRFTRCEQYDNDALSLEGIALYRTFMDGAEQRERYPMLLLDDPVCVDAVPDDDVNVSEEDQVIIQLVDSERFGGEQALADRRVKVTGALQHRWKAQHRATLLLTVQELEIKGPNIPVEPTPKDGAAHRPR